MVGWIDACLQRSNRRHTGWQHNTLCTAQHTSHSTTHCAQHNTLRTTLTTRHVVLDHRHFGEFRVPGLRQLMHTAPYMHNGSLPTIEAVVRHYSELDENRLHADGERILRRLDLSAGEAADLAAFLKSLSR